MKSELDLHGVGVTRKKGRLTAGPVFCPVYVVEGSQAANPDKVLIDDDAFVGDHENDAARIAIMRRVDTELNGLIWTRKVGVVTLQGILSRKGRVGMYDVLFFAGPTFDNGRRSDDQAAKARAAAGLPTGLPGDRKIVVADKTGL